jgi:hypothetical protein
LPRRTRIEAAAGIIRRHRFWKGQLMPIRYTLGNVLDGQNVIIPVSAEDGTMPDCLAKEWTTRFPMEAQKYAARRDSELSVGKILPLMAYTRLFICICFARQTIGAVHRAWNGLTMDLSDFLPSSRQSGSHR